MTATILSQLPGAPGHAPAGPVRVGLYGRGIQRSRSPLMHEAEGRAQGIDYGYRLFDADAGAPADVGQMFARAEAEGYAGLNVTFPFKQAALAHLDRLSHAASRVGAVNTVVFRNGERRGHNTDFWGFAESFRRGLPGVDLRCVLLLGAGGAGGAVAHALCDLGAERLLILDTRTDAAGVLADAVNAAAGRAVASAVTDAADAARTASGIVNATPVGMVKLPGTPIDPALLEARHWVAEIVYFPLETALLTAARAAGCRTLGGAGMAVFQAVRAFELFTGLLPDPDRMWATFRAAGDT